ncbi:MAG: carbohydrate ABC transporter permease [Bacilli bacterium]|jgi:ABC-type glycerol-3-phosphate transport system permease component
MKKSKKNKFSISQIVLNFLLILSIFATLYPLAMAVWCSFKTTTDFNTTKFYPTLPLQINNITIAWKACYKFIVNTIFVGGVATILSLALSSLAAYAIARLKFAGKKFIFSSMMVLLMVPGVLTLVPSHEIYTKLGLYNTYAALILPTAINGSIFGVFLLVTFFKSIPADLFEAAKIDGASEMQCFFHVALPLCRPVLGTLAIMKILGVWNDYIWPQVIIQDLDKQLISSGLAFSFTGMYSSHMPITFAGYLLASLPLIVLFSFVSKSYVEGLLSSGLKL